MGCVSCMEVALKLLARKSRSTHELTSLLRQNDFPEDEVLETIGRLTEWGYLDDIKFTELWIEKRQSHKPLGRMRLWAELEEKGIPSEIIASKVEEYFAQHPEYDIALSLAADHLRNESRNWEKTARYLERRGFTWETINSIKEALDLDGRD